ncbi:hypothetical protein MAPG_00004 [Magnaporthiopsis poae ATCC 64411]|uniref:Cytochrome P450 n=1 Tax=Magnaporthiopsis poae (strain ATCC 64411 / 73-15) TaxID=644358 RepID=A0A0C4DJU6_MAGP6|nr:hypothetical protein MAPG_00004 [Magnaporthiopsis poae ATCC 64411]
MAVTYLDNGRPTSLEEINLEGLPPIAASASAHATWLPSPLLGGYAACDQSITAVAVTVIAALVLVPIIASYLFGAKYSEVPLANAPGPFELRSQKKLWFVQNGMRLWNDTRNRFRNEPFSLLTQIGRVIILPADRALNIKNTPALNFRTQFADADALPAMPGSLTLLMVVARLSSRVLLGASACRDEEWLEITSTYTRHLMAAFLTLSFAAIHTTTDLVTQTMHCLVTDQDAIKALRQEIVEVLREGGWAKTSLYKMKLLGSAIKEAQRLKPTTLEGMRRKAAADVELPGGLKIRKGGEHKAQLVSTVPEHLPFGLGKYACPGRFFAANEVKIALCHLLIKYDWELAPGATLEPTWVGTTLLTNRDNTIRYRNRIPEIDLDSLEVEVEE